MHAIITADSAFRHQVPSGHPERPERYTAVMSAIADSASSWQHYDAPHADVEQLLGVHSQSYIDGLFTQTSGLPLPDGRLVQLDGDTYAGPDSLDAALCGAGAACLAVDLVMQEQHKTVFSAMRPPGHHAEPDRAMGFCLFSNAAIAARHAQQKWGVERVAVLDFDVHHGNGTQAAFWAEKDLFYASSHQMPLYPGTGAREETGLYHQIYNLPLPQGCSGEQFLQGWRNILLPAIEQADCGLIIISAGFDGHRDDPLGGLELTAADFAALTTDIVQLAQKTANGRVVSLLEGGYDLNALYECVKAHLDSLGHN